MDPRTKPHQINPIDDTGATVADGAYVVDVVGGRIVGLVAETGGGGGTDPTTTKGDLLVNDGSALDRLGVGSDGQIIYADSTEPLGMKWDAAPAGGGGGGPSSYAQLNKTAIGARTATGGSSWGTVSWILSHHMYMRILSFACDIFQTDTYTLYIDGVTVGSAASTGGAAPYALSITLGTPAVLTPGPHTFELRGTAARRYYYTNTASVTPLTGTYPGIYWGPWQEPAVTDGARVHGTLTFDAEGA